MYRRIKVTNNWEYLTYKHGRKSLDEKKGGLADVRWPDGTETKGVPFIAKPFQSSYSDHGNYHTVTAYRPHLVIKHRGRKFYIPMQHVLVDNVRQDGEGEPATHHLTHSVFQDAYKCSAMYKLTTPCALDEGHEGGHATHNGAAW